MFPAGVGKKSMLVWSSCLGVAGPAECPPSESWLMLSAVGFMIVMNSSGLRLRWDIWAIYGYRGTEEEMFCKWECFDTLLHK